MNLPDLSRSLPIPGVTDADLSSLIQSDCDDTYLRLANVFTLLQQVYDFSVGDESDIQSLFSDFITNNGYDITIMLQDGDIICLKFVDYPSASNRSLVVVDSNSEWYYLYNAAESNPLIGDYDNEYYPTPGKTSFWSFNQIMNSLSNQMNTQTIISRLASLTLQDVITQADIDAVVSDIPSQANAEVSMMLTTIKNLGSRLSPAALSQILKQVYYSISHYSTNEDTVDFDDRDWSVHSFNGTVYLGLLNTAAQMVASVILVAGGMVAKIISGGYLLLSTIIPKAISAAGYTEEITVNDDALNGNYAAPFFQTVTNLTTLNEYIRNAVSANKMIKIVHPALDIYIWMNPDEVTTCHVAGYANMNKRFGLNDETYTSYMGNSYLRTIVEVLITQDSGSSIRRITASLYGLGSMGGMTSPYGTFDFSLFWGLLSDGAYLDENRNIIQPFTSEIQNPDFEARFRVLQSAGLTASFMLHGYDNKSIDYVFEPLTDFEVNTSDQGIIDALVEDIAESTLPGRLSLVAVIAGLVSYFHRNGSYVNVTWAQLNNIILPVLQWASDYSSSFRFLTNLGSSAYESSVTYSIIPQTTFRENFTVVPPSYEKKSALYATIAVIATVIAVAGAYFILKRGIGRISDKFMTKKYISVQRKWDQLKSMNPDHPDYNTKVTEYLKEVRRYNLLSRLTGHSALSMVQGWEIGSSSDSFSGFTNFSDTNTPIGAMYAKLLGEANDESPVSLLTIQNKADEIYTKTTVIDQHITGI